MDDVGKSGSPYDRAWFSGKSLRFFFFFFQKSVQDSIRRFVIVVEEIKCTDTFCGRWIAGADYRDES